MLRCMLLASLAMNLTTSAILAGTTPAQEAERAEAKVHLDHLWQKHVAKVQQTRAEEVKANKVTAGKTTMNYSFKVFGTKPAEGRRLFISMHGGGNTPAKVNDQQWENQKGLYKPAEGVYLAPRAPTNTWNLWHEAHIDPLFEQLITDMVVFEGVDPNRVYLMGYSAGGDGTYQVAPRMADRFAAASMMAGHPNEASPLSLRNLPFAIHVGANDGGFKRNKIAKEWGEKLDALRQADPDGYEHLVEIHPNRGHWMNLEDASAVPWMSKFARNPVPKKVVWYQDDVTHDRFYWLAVEPGTAKQGTTVVASVKGQEVTIEKAEGVSKLLVRLDDRLVDLDQAVKISVNGKTLYEGKPARSAATLAKTLSESNDRHLAFSVEVPVELK